MKCKYQRPICSCLLFSELFLGTFTKLQKTTISFIMSACPSICLEALNPHWTNIHEIWYVVIFQEFVKKIHVSLQSDKNSGYFM